MNINRIEMENLKFWLSKYPWASFVLLLFLIQDLSFTFPHEENDVVATDEQVEKGIASQYPGDKDIESHPSVIFASGFENDFEGWSRYNTDVSKILEDPSVANSGEKLLQTTATRGVNTGGDVIYKPLMSYTFDFIPNFIRKRLFRITL